MDDDKPTNDREWIQSVVNRHEGPLINYATRLSGSVEVARDVVQDTFLRLWEAERREIEGHVTRWLYTVCRNRSLDVRRKEHRMTTLGERQMEAADAAASDHAPATEAGAAVVALVAELPERQQEAVRLKFQGGLSYREIAEVMNTTVNNVGVLLHTAVKTIRGKLAAGLAGGAINEQQNMPNVHDVGMTR